MKEEYSVILFMKLLQKSQSYNAFITFLIGRLYNIVIVYQTNQ